MSRDTQILAPDKIARRLQRVDESIEKNRQRREEDEQRFENYWTHRLSVSYEERGALALLAGDVDAAIESFAEAAPYARIAAERMVTRPDDLLDKFDPADGPAEVERTMWLALAGNDEETARAGADVALDMDEELLTRYRRRREFHRATSLGAIIADAEHAEHLDALDRAVLDDDSDDHFLSVAYRGLADDDPETVERGVQGLVDWHEATYDDPTRVHEIICLPAVALVRHARDRGWSIDIESPFVPL